MPTVGVSECFYTDDVIQAFSEYLSLCISVHKQLKYELCLIRGTLTSSEQVMFYPGEAFVDLCIMRNGFFLIRAFVELF